MHAPIFKAATLVSSACLLVACANSAAPPTPENDPALAQHLAAMGQRPGIADLGWRTAKETVRGAATERFTLQRERFPAPAALDAASAYSTANDGRGLMVWYDGALVASDFDADLTANTPTSTFSMHKSVLAIAVLRAVELGIISSLDDPVANYLGAWRDDPRGDLTFRQLLTHSSGLAHYPLNGPSTQSRDLALSSQVRATALGYAQTEAANTTFNYNNVNSQIVGLALEDALASRNLRYSEFLSQHVWRLLGNRDAALWIEKPGGSARFAAGLEAGLEDWLAIGVMLANGGRFGQTEVLTEASVATLWQASALNPAYGLGIWRGAAWEPQRRYGPTTKATVLHSEPYLAPDVYFFDGFGGQRVYVVPSRRLVVARSGEVNFGYDDANIVNTLLRGIMRAEQDNARAAYRSDDVAALYQQRFERLLREARAGSGLAGYDPLTPLNGANGHKPLPLDASRASWLDAETRTALLEYLAPRNTQAVLIWHQGSLVLANYFGDTDADAMVISRSLSKPLSVIAVGRALERGYLKSLDQPASEFLTEWQETDKADITIRQILQMRSGLEAQRPSLEADDIMNTAYLHPYHAEVIINDYPLVTEPGTRYDYSNANGELVAPLIERITGQRYEDWISREVLQPLGAAGGSIWLNRLGGTAHSGCCALLPAETWLRLSILLLSDGVGPDGARLLPEGYVDTMGTPTPQNPHTGMGLYVAGNYIEKRGAANPDVPYGKIHHSAPYLDDSVYLVDGNGNQVSYHIPRHDLIIMRLGKAPPKELVWDNAFLPNTVLRALATNTDAELIEQPRP